MFVTETLFALRLPPEHPVKRQSILAADALPRSFAERYDDRTLAYGAIHVPEKRRIVLVAPKLLNLGKVLRQTTLETDAGPHKVRRIRAFRRFDEVILAAPDGAGPVLRSDVGEMPVHRADPRFAGGNLLTTISQNNALEWISEWARHMVASQGITHVLFFDNASTDYTPEAVTECLAAVPGLQGATTVSVPLPYGPTGTKPPRGRALFLQTGLLNLARLRFAGAAQTVTCCDIDELLVSAPGQGTLAQAAMRSALGYATAQCHWRHAPTDHPEQPRFKDHLLRRDPDGTSKEKWCLKPSGPLGGAVWDIHGVAGYRWNGLVKQRDHRFYHCADITTGWKRARGSGAGHSLVEDAQTVADLKRLGLT